MYMIVAIGDSILRGILWMVSRNDKRCFIANHETCECGSRCQRNVCNNTQFHYFAGFAPEHLDCIKRNVEKVPIIDAFIVQSGAHTPCEHKSLTSYNKQWIKPLLTFLLSYTGTPIYWIGPTPEHFRDTGCYDNIHHNTTKGVMRSQICRVI